MKESHSALVIRSPLRPPPPSLMSLEHDKALEALERNPIILTTIDTFTHESFMERAVSSHDPRLIGTLLELPLATTTINECFFDTALQQRDVLSLEQLLTAAGSSNAPHAARYGASKMLPLLCLKLPRTVFKVFAKLELSDACPVIHAIDINQADRGDPEPLERCVLKGRREEDAPTVWRKYMDHRGVDAHALLVPWPHLASRDMLSVFIDMETGPKSNEMWQSPFITAAVTAAWEEVFLNKHYRMFALFVVEVACFFMLSDIIYLDTPDIDFFDFFRYERTLSAEEASIVIVLLAIISGGIATYFLLHEFYQLKASYESDFKIKKDKRDNYDADEYNGPCSFGFFLAKTQHEHCI